MHCRRLLPSRLLCSCVCLRVFVGVDIAGLLASLARTTLNTPPLLYFGCLVPYAIDIMSSAISSIIRLLLHYSDCLVETDYHVRPVLRVRRDYDRF